MRDTRSLFGVLILFICGCQLFESASPELVIKVDADIELNLREKLPVDGTGFYMNLTSSDTVDCAGLEYQCAYAFDGSTLRFNVNGIKNSLDCEGNNYHVMSELLFQPPYGTHPVRFMIGDAIENIGTIVINKELVNLSFPEIYGLRIPHETLYRIPGGTVWGYLAGEGDLDEAYAWMESNFMAYGGLANLKPGYYGYFTISDELSVSRIHPQPDAAYRSFVFHLEDDESNLEDLATRFSDEFGESVRLQLTTWTGRQL